MKSREDLIASMIGWNDNSASGGNRAICHNQSIIMEVLLDIRDLLIKDEIQIKSDFLDPSR